MMKDRRGRGAGRALAALTAAALLLCAAGCEKKEKEAPDGTAEVEAALEQMRSVTSYVLVQTTERSQTEKKEEGESVINSTSRMEMILFTEPEPRVKLTNTVTMDNDSGESESFSYAIYVVKEDDGYWQYSTNGTAWYKNAMSSSQPAETMSAGDVIDLFLSEGLSYRRMGTETLEGGDAVRYETTRTGADMVQALENMGVLNSISAMSEDQQDRIKTELEKLDGVTVAVWVDEATGYPVQFQMDVSDILEDVQASITETLGGLAPNEEWTETANRMTLTLSDYNNAPEIILPPEAAEAQSLAVPGRE